MNKYLFNNSKLEIGKRYPIVFSNSEDNGLNLISLQYKFKPLMINEAATGKLVINDNKTEVNITLQNNNDENEEFKGNIDAGSNMAKNEYILTCLEDDDDDNKKIVFKLNRLTESIRNIRHFRNENYKPQQIIKRKSNLLNKSSSITNTKISSSKLTNNNNNRATNNSNTDASEEPKLKKNKSLAAVASFLQKLKSYDSNSSNRTD